MVPRMASFVPLFPQFPQDELIWDTETGTSISDTKERIEGADRAQEESDARYTQLSGSAVPREMLGGSQTAGANRLRLNREGEKIADRDWIAVGGRARTRPRSRTRERPRTR